MCFLLLTRYTIVNQLIMYHDILLELCVLYIYSCTQEKVIHHKNTDASTDYHLCFTRVIYLVSLLSEIRNMYLYVYYTLSCALGFIDLSTSILIGRSNNTRCRPVVHSGQESLVCREGRNNLLVDFIIIFSLTITCVIFMFDDVPFDISVTYGDVFECSSPYNFRTTHSEQAATVLISMTVWMGLNQLIIALFYQYDNFILSMCIADLHLICYSYSLFYNIVYLSFPVANKIKFKLYIKVPYLYIITCDMSCLLYIVYAMVLSNYMKYG